MIWTNHMDRCNMLGRHVSKLVLDIYNLHNINQQCLSALVPNVEGLYFNRTKFSRRSSSHLFQGLKTLSEIEGLCWSLNMVGLPKLIHVS